MSRKVALITGASAGLGEQFAELFTRDGHDVILVARNVAKLEVLASRLEQAHGVKAHVMPADLGDPSAPERLFAQVQAQGLAVDFLVNNAGFGSSGPFVEQALAREVEMVEVNCTALLKLTHLFVQPMRERKQGRILNIASTAGFLPGPYMATYYATKAFVLSLSEALSFELKDSGVTVTCHCPGATHTEFTARAGNSETRLFKRSGVAKAPDVAAHAYAAMMKGQVLSIHGALNWLSAFSLRFSPRAAARSVTAKLNQQA
ncbi:SDR family NAD(P)-dependent oxidoreductase [Corallococcus llansteffanensis]|uniref:SDR family oxidoreductase n=1 Tax=Corallococcus llansteffanensis TaxID=2316731 RepID=A0A3A8QFC7_9BACT|nr:SDR family oxidoreductase [Corallococcus llansteffanensis]RKH67367.1 SDR family oxidoreductase [Corallococcus llansteffanensis]